MLEYLLAIGIGAVCGVLSGYGIGGGSLLMVFLTAGAAMQQKTAQGINLLYFLPTAAAALIFHFKNRQIRLDAVLPAAIAGCVTAALGATLALALQTQLLRKLFGGFLILVGITEIVFKGMKKQEH